MKCNWCAGTGGECGCGEGRCAHCYGSGAVADAPFDTVVDSDLSESDVTRLAKIWPLKLCPTDDWQTQQRDFVLRVEAETYMIRHGWIYYRSLLTIEEVNAFVAYWDNPLRNHTLGDFINLIANFVQRKYDSQL